MFYRRRTPAGVTGRTRVAHRGWAGGRCSGDHFLISVNRENPLRGPVRSGEGSGASLHDAPLPSAPMKDRNLLRGIVLIAIALAFGLGALRYPTGTLARAGPGLFPLMVASLLLLV